MAYTTVATMALSLLSVVSSAAPPPAASATLKGQILHPVGKVVAVQVAGKKAVEVPVDAAGRFRLTVPLDAAAPAVFETEDEYTSLWLTPGDNLTLTVDARQFDETVKYTGTGARVNNFLAAEVLGVEALDAQIAAAAARPVAAYSAYCDSVQTAKLTRLSSVLGPKPTAAETAFQRWQQREWAYEWASRRLRYGEQKKVPVSDGYYQFLSAKATPLDNPAALESEAYREYVMSALAHYARASGAVAAGSPEEVAMVREAQRRLSGPLREQVVPQLVIQAMMIGSLTVADSMQRYALTHVELRSCLS